VRLLAVVLLWSLQSYAQQHPDTSQHNKSRTESKKTGSDFTPASPAVEQEAKGAGTNTRDGNSGKDDSEERIAVYTEKLASYTRALAAFTLALIVVAVFQFVALWRQVRALNHHSDLIGQSVEEMRNAVAAYHDYVAAVSASTEALVNSERGWVLVDQTDDSIFRDTRTDELVFNAFVFSIANRGKTVTRLISFMGRCRSLPRNQNLSVQPDYGGPALTDAAPVYGRVLASGESNIPIPIPYEERVDETAIEQINDGTLIVYAYGLIKYFDSFGRPRELQFGYHYIPPRAGMPPKWQLVQQPEYNKHT